jgi:hypothetical protein
MRFLGHGSDDLSVERHAAFVSANPGQQPIVETLSTSQPTASEIIGYAWHESQVQLV